MELFSLIYFKLSIGTVIAFNGYMDANYPNRLVEYMYHKSELSWNDARKVCQQNGGDLAKIDNLDLLELIINLAEQNSTKNGAFIRDYWIGLFEESPGNAIWVSDCSSLQLPAADFDLTWDVNKNCFVRNPGYNATATADACQRSKPFLCRKYTNSSCVVNSVYSASIINLQITSYSTCAASCKSDAMCTNVVFAPFNTCYMLSEEESSQNMLIASKLCIKVTINSTLITIQNSDNSNKPKQNCSSSPGCSNCTGNYSYTGTTMPSTTWPISPTPSLSSSPTIDCPAFTSTLTTTLSTVVTDSCTLEPSSWHNGITLTSVITLTACASALTNIASTPSVQQSESVNMTDVKDIASAIAKNLSINAKETSAWERKLSCADDTRTSSRAMGFVGLICVIVPLALIALSDVKLMYVHIREKRLSATSYLRPSRGIRKSYVNK